MKSLLVDQTIDRVGKEVEFYGWVDTKRDHKKLSVFWKLTNGVKEKN